MEKKEAMKILKDFHDKSALFSVRTALETALPELLESEDEKIRKVLIDYFNRYKEQEECGINTFYGIPTVNILAWLEKQDENKEEINEASYRTGIKRVLDNPESYGLKKQSEQKPIVIIPKFRVGDEIITKNEESLTITRIDEEGYWSNDLFICGFNDSDEWELVEQKPYGQRKECLNCQFNYAGECKGSCAMKRSEQNIPNALEECEIEHIEHGKYYYCIKDYYSGGNKRVSKGVVIQALRGMSMMALGVRANEYFIPVKCIIGDSCAWSEEDELNLKQAIYVCHQNGYTAVENWLKSLRPQPKQDWSEEDEVRLQACIDTLQAKSIMGKVDTIHTNWLKSIKQRLGG